MVDTSTKNRSQQRKQWRKQRDAFAEVRRAELRYGMQLRQIAKHINDIINGFTEQQLQDQMELGRLQYMLRRYSEVIRPWAGAVASRMVLDVAARNAKAWNKLSEQIGVAMRQEIANAPTGAAMQQLMRLQVALITSLPLEAAQRVHKLTIQGISEGQRFPAIAKEILRTGQVTKSRATLIARTEVARTASVLTQARAEHVGSEGYIWRTARDQDVRPMHRKLEGTFHKWDDPPVCEHNNVRAHPGQIWNCRCYPEVVLPDLA